MTDLNDVTSMVQTYWPTLMMDTLKETNILVNLCNRDYEGSLGPDGNVVRVNQMQDIVGETLTIDGVGGGTTFTPEDITSVGVDINANRRFVGSTRIADITRFQSMLASGGAEPEQLTSVRMKLAEAVSRQINTYLYGLVAPAATSVAATLSASVLAGVNTYAVTEQWNQMKGWYGLIGPSYNEDVLLDTTLTSGDFVDDKPVVGGRIGTRRFGFNLFADNSTGNADIGLFFHPDFLYLVLGEPRFLVSSRHSSNEFSHNLSVDLVGGGILGHDGDVKHTTRTLV